MWESFAGWHRTASLSPPPPGVGSSQTLGPTWGPEVLCPHTWFMDFCKWREPGGRQREERGEVRPRAHCMSLGTLAGTEGLRVLVGAGVLDPAYLPPGLPLRREQREREGERKQGLSFRGVPGVVGKEASPQEKGQLAL